MNYPIRSNPNDYSFPKPPARWRPYDAVSYGPVIEPEPNGAAGLLEAVKGSRGVLVLCALSATILALAIAWVQEPVYRAEAILEVEGSSAATTDAGNASVASHQDVTEPYIQTQIKILRSETLLQRVVDKLNLAKRSEYEPEQKFWRRWSRPLSESTQRTAERGEVLKKLNDQLTIRSPGQSRLIEIQSESSDPQLAADIVNTLAMAYTDFNIERRVNGAKVSSVSLEKQVSDLRGNLERSEQELQRYAAGAGLLMTGAGNETVADSRLRQLQDGLSKAQEARIAEQAKYDRAQSNAAESLPEVLDDETLRSYRIRLTDLRRQLAELTATYQPAHYKVRECQAQIRELETALERGRTNALGRIRNQYLSAVQREKMLQEDYNRQFKVVTGQSQGAVHYNMLKREVDTNRQLYTVMLQKVKEAGIASEIRASNVQIIDSASIPIDPVRPSPPLYAAVGLMVGALLGLGRAMRKRKPIIQAPGDATVHLNLPELGVIPRGEIASVNPLRTTGRFSLRRGGSDAFTSELELASWNSKQSIIAESFRAALASVRFSEINSRWPLTLAVTSACPGEGKTVIASNLAIVLAESGRQVLLIDGDLRRPRLHDIFHLPNTTGFADLLRSNRDPGAFSASLALKTEIPGLCVLPSGPDSASAASLLQSDRPTEVLRRMRQQFDAVVIDTPPLSVADPRILGQLADGVVFVIRANHTPPEVVSAACRQLLEDGATVIGTILNSWDPKKASNHYASSQWHYMYTNAMAAGGKS
jgi:polysaccharide biosynthesis transport protein